MINLPRNTLFFNTCNGLDSKLYDRRMYETSELQKLAATDRNPSQESRYRELLTQANIPFTTGGGFSMNTNVQGFGTGGNAYGDAAGAFFSPSGTSGAQYGAGAGASATSALDSARQFRDFTIESNQPAIQGLEASKTPLNARYDALISQLTARETKESGAQSLALTREYGKRGILPSSGMFEQDLMGKTQDISQFYGATRQEVEADRGMQTAELDKLIGGLKSGNPENSISSAMSLLSLNESQRQFALSQLMQQRELEFKKEESQRNYELASKPKEQDRYATIGEGSTIFDLLLGKGIYTAPKTTASTSGSGSSVNYYSTQPTWKVVK